VVFPTDEFKAQSKSFVFVHIDVDSNKAVASRFGVGGIPDLRFLKNDGTEVHKVVGYKGMALMQDFEKAKELGK
jgi:thioredoxin-like negative regulator of GroEL